MKRTTIATLAAFLVVAAQCAGTAARADARQAADATRAEIKTTFGAVPTFVGAIADAALPGIWAQERDLEMSTTTALDVKTKALIALAVAAQIPCEYCIFADTQTARQNGATDQEIAEAVAMAGLTRNVSTILNGMQVDMATFRKEMGGM